MCSLVPNHSIRGNIAAVFVTDVLRSLKTSYVHKELSKLQSPPAPGAVTPQGRAAA